MDQLSLHEVLICAFIAAAYGAMMLRNYVIKQLEM